MAGDIKKGDEFRTNFGEDASFESQVKAVMEVINDPNAKDANGRLIS